MYVLRCSYNRNSFPPHYQGITEVQLPGELFQEAVSVEYALQQPVRAPPSFILVLDLSQSLEALTVRLCSLPCFDGLNVQLIIECHPCTEHICAIVANPQVLPKHTCLCLGSTTLTSFLTAYHQAKTCMQEMKQSVKQMLQMLPEYCLVGLITFGAMVTGVHLHTLNLLMLMQIPMHFVP